METFDPGRLSRRSLLRAMTALAGAAALPPFGMRPARATTPDLPRDFGKGRTVAVIGAGMAGLTAGWKLAKSGFKVTIYEANSRYGGRSLTVRPDDDNGQRGAYRKWWFNKYNPQALFPAMYVSRYQEDKAPPERPANVEQVCKFADDTWSPGDGKPPVELFLNAGPGRIPSDHAHLLQLCGEIGVELEPYIFQSNYNLLRSKDFREGQPIAYNQINYSLRGELAAKWAKIENPTCNFDDDPVGMLSMLKQFGDLDAKCEFPSSPRLGYSDLPGGWNTPGKIKDKVPLEDVLKSGFVGGGDPELTPGSFLFNTDNILWQNSLMQPVGGMDRIWQRLLVQRIPEAAIRLHPNDPRESGMRGRQIRYVGDLVLLKYPVTRIENVQGTKKIRVMTKNSVEVADFCLSTMAPNLLQGILPADQFPRDFTDALGQVEQVPAIKVGWQARRRFWEKENRIYGGISWTDDDIGQIWYPSEEFNAPTGVLTGAYNRGPVAEKFGRLTQAERIAKALEGGQHLHPATGPNQPGFESEIYTDRGVTIAWHYMPYQIGGWAGLTATRQPQIYQTIIKPQGQLFLAGDAYSYLPGWLEGAVTSVYKAIEALPSA
jgi:monoamine oxidase